MKRRGGKEKRVREGREKGKERERRGERKRKE